MPPRSADAIASPDLDDLIRRQLHTLSHRDDPDVARLTAEIQRRHGCRVAAVILYGSYLRGKRDTLLDFYVLLTELQGALPRLQAWGNRALPPNVYHLSLADAAGGQGPVRAKYATLTVSQFEAAMADFHCYFWARFTQPAGLVAVRNDAVAAQVTGAIAMAVHRFAREVAPVMRSGRPEAFNAAEFWQRGLALTYGCELRAEDPSGVESLYHHHRDHLQALLRAYAASTGAAVRPGEAGRYLVSEAGSSRRASLRWGLRRAQGRVLSVLRLIKAAGTFDDPLDYLLWKIERHSGIYIAPTERQRRHPLIFAWGLLWRLYRRGAFR